MKFKKSAPISLPIDFESRKGSVIFKLRLLFLVPLAIAIFFIVLILIFTIRQHEHLDIQHNVVNIQVATESFYEGNVLYDTKALLAIMDGIRQNRILKTAFLHRDRKTLLTHAEPLFKELKRDFGVTHFYFTGPDRVNLLRVHAPQKYGDTINRSTTLISERTGKISSGVELGPLGTFTLRVVEPWYEEGTHKLIGYIELGMEIDRILAQLQNFFGVNVFVLVDKQFLNKSEWENGMRVLGRTPDWDRFPEVVLDAQTEKEVPPPIAKRIRRGKNEDLNTTFYLEKNGDFYRAIALPIKDASNRPVAQMLIIANISYQINTMHQRVLIAGISASVIGVFLLVFFNLLAGRIARRIENDEQKLKQLATHDELTGLYNHRIFYALLKKEIDRSIRYNRPIALLMIDIDHFKRVNDEYGHQAGDMILRELGSLLQQQARVTDSVCRYGGEELMIIIPECDEKKAIMTAERIREKVEVQAFSALEDRSINITVSIGVISCLAQNKTEKMLVSRVDSALYAAKNGGRNRVCTTPVL